MKTTSANLTQISILFLNSTSFLRQSNKENQHYFTNNDKYIQNLKKALIMVLFGIFTVPSLFSLSMCLIHFYMYGHTKTKTS